MKRVNHSQILLRNIKKKLKINQLDLAKKLGINPVQISRYVTGVVEMRKNKYEQIAEMYPDCVPTINENSFGDVMPVDTNLIKVPFVPHVAHAGYVNSFDDLEYYETLPEMYVPEQEHKGDYFVFEIMGDSMECESRNSINENDKVLAVKIDKEQWESASYKKYLFIIVTDGIMCKKITNFDKNTGDITCHSLNSIYPDFDVNMRDVKQLFYVKKVIERSIFL